MDIHELYKWKDRIQKRQDMERMLTNKNVLIHFKNDQQCVAVFVEGQHIQINEHEQEQPHVTIHAQMPVLQDIWNGKKRLLTWPAQTLEAKGPYRDLLFVEALFHLAA